ncbi:MAG: TetR/AcrR family transcriptional regulator [Bacteroidales bacterium]|jgi:AcrR family transcriptional regulator|nr:TetR/AcrR family transcriptional regulator [Bacteroidales bacterium]MDD2824304.1 TetR/AcrR family transcriptional regulator [Bacteroidales bacterium]MDD3101074.1 TetR/AcrR family transcriptional regulator [Bacteroidales bacterium]MDD3639627.1 TetR/AcrR family transcriptional regulator [Bacteroidales bacterium]MDD3944415.1 TetR/AcrR family transcriptional regulator [Bacteroidales bacterium]
MGEPGKKTTEIKLLEGGRMLFWKYGFRKVSVEEICQSAGVSKMTFYRYFESKTALAKRILDGAVEEGIARFSGIMDSEVSAEEKMRRIILLKTEGTADISREFIEDIYSSRGEELQQYMMQLTGKTAGMIIETFRKAQEKGFFRKDFKPEMLIAMSMKMIDLLTDKHLNSIYSSANEMIVEMTRILTCGISAKNEI